MSQFMVRSFIFFLYFSYLMIFWHDIWHNSLLLFLKLSPDFKFQISFILLFCVSGFFPCISCSTLVLSFFSLFSVQFFLSPPIISFSSLCPPFSLPHWHLCPPSYIVIVFIRQCSQLVWNTWNTPFFLQPLPSLLLAFVSTGQSDEGSIKALT